MKLMQIRITNELDEMDIALIHNFLTHSYWSDGIPKTILYKALQHSICFAVLDHEKTIGFARMVTDRATFGYLADVFVIEKFRGRGVSKLLMEAVVAHPQLQGLRRMMLATSDAHGLYEQYGYEKISDSSMLMQDYKPGIYTRSRDRDHK